MSSPQAMIMDMGSLNPATLTEAAMSWPKPRTAGGGGGRPPEAAGEDGHGVVEPRRADGGGDVVAEAQNGGGGVAAPAVAVDVYGHVLKAALLLHPGQGRVQIQHRLAQAHAGPALAVPAAGVAVAEDLPAPVHEIESLGQITLLPAAQAVGDHHQPGGIFLTVEVAPQAVLAGAEFHLLPVIAVRHVLVIEVGGVRRRRGPGKDVAEENLHGNRGDNNKEQNRRQQHNAHNFQSSAFGLHGVCSSIAALTGSPGTSN